MFFFLIVAAIQKKKGKWKEVYFTTSFTFYTSSFRWRALRIQKVWRSKFKTLTACCFFCMFEMFTSWCLSETFSSCSHCNRRKKCQGPPNVPSHYVWISTHNCVCLSYKPTVIHTHEDSFSTRAHDIIRNPIPKKKEEKILLQTNNNMSTRSLGTHYSKLTRSKLQKLSISFST